MEAWGEVEVKRVKVSEAGCFPISERVGVLLVEETRSVRNAHIDALKF